ncbi:angiomotin [Tanacetum coccineum]
MSDRSSSTVTTATIPDFNLPDEILSVLPTDPYDQLDLARKITSMALASRVSKLEGETSKLRNKLNEKDRVILELEAKVNEAEEMCRSVQLRLQITVEDNVKLVEERDSLALACKKLGRDLAKLETFKRQLMQSLNENDSTQAATVDIGTYDQSAPRAYPEEETNGYRRHRSFSSVDGGNMPNDASKLAGQRYSMTQYISTRATPTGTPKIISTSVSPRKYSASGATSPTKNHHEGRTGGMSSWYSSSQQSSAGNSPPRGPQIPGRANKIDGKEVFRQARSRLSYEQFSAFLANIKELNAQRQSREETLRKAEEIFGNDNKDLYLSFQALLNRNKQ